MRHLRSQLMSIRMWLGSTVKKELCIDCPWRGILNTAEILRPPRAGWLNVQIQPEMIDLPTADCHPVTIAPGLSRLFLDFCAGKAGARSFYGALGQECGWQTRPAVPAHWDELVNLLAAQNRDAWAAPALKALGAGAGAVVTGQQVGLFGGPLFTPYKAATALARARQATKAGQPHAAIFWLATEDHDFAEIDHVVFPARHELRKLSYSAAPKSARPVGGLVLDESILPLVDEAWELLGPSETMEALAAAYKPGNTLGQAFAAFYGRVFAAQGLLVLDAAGRDFHRMGAPVLQAALERADEMHARLLERNAKLAAAGYHAQVAVVGQSSLLFLIDHETGARLALKRLPESAKEPNGLWQAGRDKYSTADLVGILQVEPERISPSALLRPVFQDYLLSTSLTIGGPAEVAYFAQSAVLFEEILGRMTPVQPRFSATLVEPAIAELLHKHEVTVDRVFAETPDSLAKLLAARAMPIEGKRKLASAGNALDSELTTLLDWMRSQDAGLGRSAETAASKMRYQMNRLRNLSASFQLQREASLGRHAQALSQALFPGGVLQERVIGAAYFFAAHGLELAEHLTVQAEKSCPGHSVIWL
jgi:bacillithiol biosynthesis cysteine-adding enzyme BshC